MKEVYLAVNEYGRYKIGMSKNASSRVRDIELAGGVKITLLKSWSCVHARVFEDFLHRLYNKHQLFGEWFTIPYNPINEIEKLHNKLLKVESFAIKQSDSPLKEFYVCYVVKKLMEELLPDGHPKHKRLKRKTDIAK